MKSEDIFVLLFVVCVTVCVLTIAYFNVKIETTRLETQLCLNNSKQRPVLVFTDEKGNLHCNLKGGMSE